MSSSKVHDVSYWLVKLCCMCKTHPLHIFPVGIVVFLLFIYFFLLCHKKTSIGIAKKENVVDQVNMIFP